MGDDVWGPRAKEQDSLEWEWSRNPGQFVVRIGGESEEWD